MDETKKAPDEASFVQKFSSANMIRYELDSGNNVLRVGDFMYSEEQSTNKLSYALCRNSPVSFQITGWKWKAGVTAVDSITFSLKITMKETIT